MQTPNSGVTAPVSYARHPPWDSRAVHVAFHSAGRTVVPARKIKSCLGWTSNSTNCCDTMLCSRAVRTPASFDTRQRNDSKSYISLLLIVSSSVLPWEKFRARGGCDLRQRGGKTGETVFTFAEIPPPPPFLSEQIGIHWCFAQRVTRGTETVRLNLPQRNYLFIHSEEKQHNFFWHCRKNKKPRKKPTSLRSCPRER